MLFNWKQDEKFNRVFLEILHSFIFWNWNEIKFTFKVNFSFSFCFKTAKFLLFFTLSGIVLFLILFSSHCCKLIFNSCFCSLLKTFSINLLLFHQRKWEKIAEKQEHVQKKKLYFFLNWFSTIYYRDLNIFFHLFSNLYVNF